MLLSLPTHHPSSTFNMPAAYLAPHRNVDLYGLLEASSSKTAAPVVELNWEPFQTHVEAFLNAVSVA